MKILQQNYEVQNNLTGKSTKFRIASNPIMFDILRNKMYEDPIGSICREISSNARDANREAGNENKSIEIWIPGEYYVIKDNGPGMSPETIEKVYTVFGESTKRDTNYQTGGFGLGSKTIFSKADQTTVITIHKGIKYIYSIFINTTGEGEAQLVSSKPTEEPSGTTIKIPVKAIDIKDFTEKTYYYTKHWKPQPIYHGGIKNEPLEPLIKTENWSLYPENSNLKFNCLCDEIPYSFGTYSKNWSGEITYNKIDDIDIPIDVVLKFKTGDVEISANREKLQISEYTKNSIKEKIILFNTEYCKIIKEKIQKEKNILNVFKILNNRYIESQEWTWNNNTFIYPLPNNSHQNYQQHSRSWALNSPIHNDLVLYFTNKSYYSSTLNSSASIKEKIEKFEKVAFVIFDKEEEEFHDRETGNKIIEKRFTSYDKGKITALLRSGYSYVYILKKDILPKLEPCFNLTELKVVQNDEITTPSETKIRKKREPKTKIRVRTRRYNSWDYTHIGWDTKIETIYTKKDLIALFPYGGRGPVEVFELTAKIKTPRLGPNWIEWEDYLKREVYHKLLTEQINEIFIAIDLSEGLLNRIQRYNIKKLDFLNYSIFFNKWDVNIITLDLLRHLRSREIIKFNVSKVSQRHKELLDKNPILDLLQQASPIMTISKNLTTFINGHFST